MNGASAPILARLQHSASRLVGYIPSSASPSETGVVMVVYLHDSLDKRLASGVALKHRYRSAAIEGAVQRSAKTIDVTAVLASLFPYSGKPASAPTS